MSEAAQGVLATLHQQIATANASVDEPEAPADDTTVASEDASETEEPSEPPPPPKPSISERQQALREQLLAKQQQRAQAPAADAREFEQLRQQVAQLQRTPSVNDFLDRARRDPKGMAAALRSEGINPEDVLRELTNDVLSPGAARAAAVGNDALEYTKALARKVEALQQSREIEAQQRQIAAEERAFIEFVDNDDYPSLKALSPEERVEEATQTWAELQRRGYDYDRELVAVETEARLAKYRERWSPPVSMPDKEKQKTPAAKKKLSTLKPEMSGEGGSNEQRYRTEQQRDADQIARLRLQLKGK